MTSQLARILIGVGMTAGVAMAAVAFGQELGNAGRGEALAKSVCAECHNVQKGERSAGRGNAPSFTTLATTPGMTPMAIRVALRTSHSKMPNLVLSNDQIDDVIAYLAVLRP